MHSTRKVALFLTPLALAVLGLAAPARAAVYVVGSGNEFGTLDLTSGDFNYITTLPATESITGIGFINNTLYGLGFVPGTIHPTDHYYSGEHTDVFTIDTATGAESIPETIAGFTAATATAVGSVFYGLNGLNGETSAYLDVLDPNAQTDSTLNKATGIYADGLLVEQGGTLYAADLNNTGGTGYDAIDSIDPATGGVATVGDTGVQDDLTAGVSIDSTLYGFGSSGIVYTIDTGSGAASQAIDSSSQPETYSLGNNDYIIGAAAGPEASPAPEPSQYGMLALMGLGLGGLLLRARRQPKAE